MEAVLTSVSLLLMDKSPACVQTSQAPGSDLMANSVYLGLITALRNNLFVQTVSVFCVQYQILVFLL